MVALFRRAATGTHTAHRRRRCRAVAEQFSSSRCHAADSREVSFAS
uniref:Uncharacterized protein n=1 Tax=Anopheles merus TaxID=30066 RepID=A0A182USU0_ANOME